MKYIFIAYLAFGSWWSPSWQMLEPKVFPNHETCSRYMNEIADDLRFHKKHGQNGVQTWRMTCRHYWETDAEYQKFLEDLRSGNYNG